MIRDPLGQLRLSYPREPVSAGNAIIEGPNPTTPSAPRSPG